MIPALHVSAYGMQQGVRLLDRAANDTANVSTAGYRASGRRDAAGPLWATGNPLDVALESPGWFRVASHDGTGFGEVLATRAGTFQRSGDGYVVAPDGRYAVGLALDAAGRPTGTETRIRIPDGATAISVDRDGVVSATMPDGTTSKVAAFSVARYPNDNGLEHAGGGLYRATANAGAPQVGAGSVVPGAVEQSNVDLSESLVQTLLARHQTTASAVSAGAAGDLLDELARVGQRR